MATTIPVHQAIKFYSEANDVFNETTECPCDSSEKWTYIIKPVDVTEVQVTVPCIEVPLGSDIITNGSFEIPSEDPLIPEDWTLSSTEQVERANTDPYIGSWSLRWNAPTGTTSSATQDTGHTFFDGEKFLLEFYAKVENPAVDYHTPLEVYLGGQNYLVTPTEEYTKISIPVVFLANGIDTDLIFQVSTILSTADFLYVDKVSLRSIDHVNNKCDFNLVYNGDFEYGQHKVTGSSPVSVTFDGWEIDGTVEATLIGGLNGSRCPVLYGAGSFASIGQTWPVIDAGYTYKVSFYARAATEGDEVIVSAGLTPIDTYALTTQWTLYTTEFVAPDDLTELTFLTNDDEIYIDSVLISLLSPLNEDSVYVHDTDNDIYFTDPITINNFQGGYNALFGWGEIIDDTDVGCLQIIFEFAEDNVIINPKFVYGTGNDFDDWTESIGNGTIVEAKRTNYLLRSQEFDNASWTKSSMGTGSNPVVTANFISAPDGSLTADRIIFNSGGGVTGSDQSIISQAPITAAGTYNGSIYLKGAVGGEQLVFRHVAGGSYTLLTLTTQWQRFNHSEIRAADNYEFGIRQGLFGPLNSAATIYAWGAQLENDEYATEYIPTTTAAVTVNDGVNQSRALRFNRNTNTQTITQTGILDAATTYTFSLFARKAHGSPSITLSSTSGTLGTITPDSSELKRYSIQFTTGVSDADLVITSTVNSTGVVIDNLYLSESGTGVHYSELFTYLPSDTTECVPEIVWYDSQDEVFGINYESGFKNKMRIHDLNFQILSYPTDDFVKTLNGLESSISRAVIKKQKTLNITPSPEFIHDRLSVAVRHTNIEVDTVPYCSVEETTYTVVDSETGCRLRPAQVVLGIEGEILAERSINCEE